MKLSKKARYTLGIGAILVVTGGSLAAVPFSSTPQPKERIPDPVLSAKTDFAPLTPPQAVPRNVLGALYVPKASTVLAWINYDRSNGTFDRSVELGLNMSLSQEGNFFQAALRHYGWTVVADKTIPGGTEIFGRIAGNDGNFWEVGIKTPFQLPQMGASVHRAKGVPSAFTRVAEVRLLQLGDA